MSAAGKEWIWHVILGGLLAYLSALKNATADGFSAHDFQDAGSALLIYAIGVIQTAPWKIREPGTQTRSTDVGGGA